MERLERMLREMMQFDSLTPKTGVPESIAIDGREYGIAYPDRKDNSNGKTVSVCYYVDHGSRTITMHGLDPGNKMDAYLIRAVAMSAQMEYTGRVPGLKVLEHPKQARLLQMPVQKYARDQRRTA